MLEVRLNPRGSAVQRWIPRVSRFRLRCVNKQTTQPCRLLFLNTLPESLVVMFSVRRTLGDWNIVSEHPRIVGARWMPCMR
jgi:hypothetical protein